MDELPRTGYNFAVMKIMYTSNVNSERSILVLRAALIPTLLFVVCLCAACGAGTRSSNSGQASEVMRSGVAAALSELAAMEAPQGADVKVFENLRSELARQLTAKGTAKITCAPPSTAASRVTDLELLDQGGGAFSLVWHYQNLGDYNQDGFVGVADITPIAISYGQTYAPADVNSALAVIDGSGNGTIDISDVTPIAMNFGVNCAGYLVHSQSGLGSWASFDDVAFTQAIEDGGRLRFEYALTPTPGAQYRVVPQDESGYAGIRSNAVPELAGQPPNIVAVGPFIGDSGSQSIVSANTEGTQPLTYSWNFNGGAEPGTSSDTSPEVTLGAPGTYDCVLLVTNANGSDSCAFALTVTGQLPAPGDWRMFGRDAKHTRRSPYVGAQTEHLKWSFETNGFITKSSPAIGADGSVFIGSVGAFNLYAFNANGGLKWGCLTDLGAWVNSSPAVGASGTVYAGSSGGTLFAVNPNGSVRWGYQTGYAGDFTESSPTIGADGTIYVGGWDTYLHAINPDGSRKWRFKTGDIVDSSPAIGDDGTIYVGSDDSFLYAVNQGGGQVWAYNTGNPVFSSPAIGDDGTIYVGSGNSLFAINPNGTLKWKYDTGGSVASSPAIAADGTVYVGSADYNLYAINPAGELVWRYETYDAIYSSPAIGADGTVYIGSNDFYVRAITPDGTLLWRYQTNDVVRSSPAIGPDGTVYVGSNDWCIYAFGD